MRDFRKGEECLNCATKLSSEMRYCPDCGQENDHKNVSVATFAADLAEDTFSLDSRLGRTILPFMFSPGKLTREFIGGRRRRYMPPLRLYLFASFVFFLSVGTDREIISLNTNNNAIKSNNGLSFSSSQGDGSIASFSFTPDANDSAIADSVKRGLIKPRKKKRPELFTEAIQKGTLTEPGFFEITRADSTSEVNRILVRKFVHFLDNKAEFGAYLKSKVPYFFFLMVPVFALFLKLFYFRKHRLYIEHFILLMHVQAFAFLVMALSNFIDYTVNWLSSGKSGWDSSNLFFIWAVGYFVIAQKRTYQQSFRKTIFKSVLFLFSAGLCLAACFVIFLVVSILTFE
ncbi:MAG: DUF3667 domain-containing protein [Bacteroidota bacterium]